REESHSLAGLGDGPGERVTRTSRFRLVLVPVDGDTLVEIEDDIRAGQQMRGVAGDPNDHLLFAPMAEAIDLSAPDPSCSLTVVALRALSDGDAALNEPASPQTALHSRPGGSDGRVKEDIGADHAVLH